MPRFGDSSSTIIGVHAGFEVASATLRTTAFQASGLEFLPTLIAFHVDLHDCSIARVRVLGKRFRYCFWMIA